MAGWIKMPLGTEVGLGPGDFVLDRDPAPRPQKAVGAPSFRTMSIVAKRQDGSRWHLAWRWVSVGPDHIVLDGNPAPHHKRGAAPNFPSTAIVAAAVCKLDAEVGLGLGDFVLAGDPGPLPKRGTASFRAHVYCGQTAGWMKTPLGNEVDLGPGHIVRLGPSSAPRKGHISLPPSTLSLRPMPVVATVAHLSYC